VPEPALRTIFEPFFRVDEARDRLSGGAGLGLSITDRVIRAHGGTVRAHNHPDGGLVIELTLPTEYSLLFLAFPYLFFSYFYVLFAHPYCFARAEARAANS
jgi:hypothetical protein